MPFCLNEKRLSLSRILPGQKGIRVLRPALVNYFRGGSRLRRARCSLAPYLLAAVLTWMAVGFVENQLTDRYLYIPVGCIAALQMIASHERPNGLVSAIT